MILKITMGLGVGPSGMVITGRIVDLSYVERHKFGEKFTYV